VITAVLKTSTTANALVMATKIKSEAAFFIAISSRS
jgi:hypothetical protein